MELITVEVSGKFGPKANGKWYGVKKPLASTDFVAGQTYEIETEAWESKGKSGVNIISKKTVDSKPQAKNKAVTNEELKGIEKVIVTSYEDNKNRRILRQGVVQAVIQSPSLAGLSFTSASEVVALVKEVSNQLMQFIEEK